MKRLFGFIFISVFMLCAATPYSQDEKSNCDTWGSDSVKAMQAISIYKEFYKQNNYADAYTHWMYVFKNAPGARKFTYVDGPKIIEDKISKTKDAAKKEKLIDTLFMIYDQRIKCFGEEGYVLGRKGYDMVKYRSSDVTAIYNTFKKSVELAGNESEYFVLEYYFKYVVKAYEKKMIDKKQVLKEYEKVNEIVDYNISSKSKYANKYEDAQLKVASEFIDAKIVENCEQAKSLFEENYKTNPEDAKVWKQIYDVMRSIGCLDDDLFIEVAEKLFTKSPEPRLAAFLGKAKLSKKQTNDAINYYKKAVELENDNDKKAEYTVSLAEAYQIANDYSSARSYAYKAAEMRPKWGEPYVLIGNLYASSGPLCGPGTGFQSQVVTWVAIDMYQKAKSIDPGVTESVNKKINNYAQYMPTKEDIFFQNLKEGDSFKVECWIQQSTTVRARKE